MGKVCCSQLKGADKDFNEHVFCRGDEVLYRSGLQGKKRLRLCGDELPW